MSADSNSNSTNDTALKAQTTADVLRQMVRVSMSAPANSQFTKTIQPDIVRYVKSEAVYVPAERQRKNKALLYFASALENARNTSDPFTTATEKFQEEKSPYENTPIFSNYVLDPALYAQAMAENHLRAMKNDQIS